MPLNGSSAVYLSGDGVEIWMITGLDKLLSMLKRIETIVYVALYKNVKL